MACSGVSREIGGRTPNASAVRKMTFAGWPAYARNHRVVDVLERVGRARVLGDLVGIEIEQARARVHRHVFEDRAEADGVPDLRLVLPREPDALGVASALEVEDAVVAPAVLVVADQAAQGVGRKRGLAGAGEPEKQRHVSTLSLVGRAVHGEHGLPGQQVVHDGERRFLHFPGVAGAHDQHHALLKVDDDAGLRVGAVPRPDRPGNPARTGS